MFKKISVILVFVSVSFFSISIVRAQVEPKTGKGCVLFATSALDYDHDFSMELFYLDEAIALDTNNSLCYSFRGDIYLSQNKYLLALMDFDQAIRLNSGDYFNFLGRGKVWYFMGDYTKALEDLNQAFILEPFDASIYFWRSKVYKILGDSIGSEADIQTYEYLNSL